MPIGCHSFLGKSNSHSVVQVILEDALLSNSQSLLVSRPFLGAGFHWVLSAVPQVSQEGPRTIPGVFHIHQNEKGRRLFESRGVIVLFGIPFAQVAIGFQAQRGVPTFPKSVTASRVKANLDSFFAMAPEDVAVRRDTSSSKPAVGRAVCGGHCKGKRPNTDRRGGHWTQSLAPLPPPRLLPRARPAPAL